MFTEDSNRVLRNRTVGRNASSSYRDIVRIRPAPYPPPTSPSRPPDSPRGRTKLRQRISLSPPKHSPTRTSPIHSFDRFIPHSSSPISLRHLLSSPPGSPQREGSQSPTNPQLHSPGKPPEWPNSYNDTLHSYRLASALELPISPKILHFHSQSGSPTRSTLTLSHEHTLLPALLDPPALLKRSQRKRLVPPDPVRILDAPDLRDDYYAQPLSWSVRGTIAVALGMEVFLWNPQDGVSQLPSDSIEDVTAVTFNCTGDILAIAREDGSILLQAPNEGAPRIHIAPLSQGAVGALAWRPAKASLSNSILTEFLVIGTFDGRVVLCEITWDVNAFVSKVERRGLWDDVHTDQICGIAWSNDGLSFATGANDNKVCTYEIPMGTIGVQTKWEKKYEWMHNAAVKGLAYKSGKGGVLAAGGGVNDKKIRFYNTHHGTLLSSLDVSAQITTLQWSPSTTEILATFGYTAPGISTKCAVYAYPSLQCLFDFEIADETRALYAVISPCGRDICVAGSDECVRFYRIWGDTWNKRVDREKSPVRDLVAGVDPQMHQEDRTRRMRSGLSVIR